MASFFGKMKRLPGELPHGTSRPGFKGFLVDKGTRYAAAAAFGAAKGYYGEKFVWRGHGADLWIGGGLTLGVALLKIFSMGRSTLPTVERLGDAGMMSALNSLGASWGLEKAGRAVSVVSPGKNVRSLGGHSIVGAIPAVSGGSYLTPDEIARFASRR